MKAYPTSNIFLDAKPVFKIYTAEAPCNLYEVHDRK